MRAQFIEGYRESRYRRSVKETQKGKEHKSHLCSGLQGFIEYCGLHVGVLSGISTEPVRRTKTKTHVLFLGARESWHEDI